MMNFKRTTFTVVSDATHLVSVPSTREQVYYDNPKQEIGKLKFRNRVMESKGLFAEKYEANQLVYQLETINESESVSAAREFNMITLNRGIEYIVHPHFHSFGAHHLAETLML